MEGHIAIRSKLWSNGDWLIQVERSIQKKLPTETMSLKRLGPFGSEGMAYRRPLGMSDAGMDVVNPSSHRLNRSQIRRHESFSYGTPVTQISRQAEPRMFCHTGRETPRIE